MRQSSLICLAVGCIVVGACKPQQTSSDGEPTGNQSADSGQVDNATAAAEPAALPELEMSFETRPFGKLPDGSEVTLYTCKNARGMTVSLIDYGATVVSVETYDRDGNCENINLGFDSIDGYLGDHPFFGATVGRYCNRIGGGTFMLDDQTYTLAKNNGENHLHGGEVGFNRVLWSAEKVESDDSIGVAFQHTSVDGDEGYPGELTVTATYILTNDNELKVEFSASTTKPTPVNLTNHNYWNLGGAGSGSILDHELTIHADQSLQVDDQLIPTGQLVDVRGTPLDFRDPRPIGSRIRDLDMEPQGYDHCYVLRGGDEPLPLAASVKDPSTGRVMEIRTTQPGIQFYTGNFLNGSESNGGHGQHEAFCLETQHYPDSPNRPEFPSTILKPGETYHQITVHQFLID